MKYLLLAIIKIYWLLPKKERRKCIFKETCSKHVFRITKFHGFQKGLAALRLRQKQCRAGFYFINEHCLRLADRSLISVSLITDKMNSEKPSSG